MVKNTPLRNSSSSLSLRAKPIAETRIINEQSRSTSISDAAPELPGKKPVPTYHDSPLPMYATHYPGTPSNPQIRLSYPRTTPVADAQEKPKPSDILDDEWFEQKLRSLIDKKVELAKLRLEHRVSLVTQGHNTKSPMQQSACAPEPEDDQTALKSLAKPVEEYTQPFCEFLTENPTVFHAVDYFKKKLKASGFTEVCVYFIFFFVSCPQSAHICL